MHKLKWFALVISSFVFLNACSGEATLSKSEFEMAAVTHYDFEAVLDLKTAVGGPVMEYIQEADQASPQSAKELLDEQGGGSHPGGKKILGLYADLKPGITNDQAKSIVENLRATLPEGYTASFFNRTSRYADNVFHSIIVQKTCGRQCSAKFAPFQEPNWKSGRDRLPMAETLVHREALIGLSSTQLFSLLGKGSEMQIPPGTLSGGVWMVYEYSMRYDCGKERSPKLAYLKVLAINDYVAKAWISRKA